MKNKSLNFVLRVVIFVLFTSAWNTVLAQNKVEILSVPAGNEFAKINPSGTTILPSGRFLSPAGDFLRITDDPFGLAVSPDGNKAVTLHDGVFTVIDLRTLKPVRVPSYDNKIKSPLSKGSYLGVAFAYFVVLPLVFAFLTTTAPVGVAVMTDIAKYLDFTLTLFFAFGVTFEVPIFTIVLVWTGMVTPQQFSEARPYIIVGAFVVAMFLTPPDALSQTLLAVPICLLFEAGLLFARFFIPKSHYQDDDKNLIAKE